MISRNETLAFVSPNTFVQNQSVSVSIYQSLSGVVISVWKAFSCYSFIRGNSQLPADSVKNTHSHRISVPACWLIGFWSSTQLLQLQRSYALKKLYESWVKGNKYSGNSAHTPSTPYGQLCYLIYLQRSLPLPPLHSTTWSQTKKPHPNTSHPTSHIDPTLQ